MATRMSFALALAACVLLISCAAASAQEYFGKNKVNYAHYNWQMLETQHFTIYFDKPALPAAEFAAREAERALASIQRALKYTLKDRYPIVIYNSHNGFAASNISPQEQSEFTGGYTEFLKGRVVIPFTGSYADFRHVIHHELVHAVTMELWTGGAWLDALVSARIVLPPLWVAEGLAEYLSQGGWDIEADNFMRDAAITGYVPVIEDLSNSYFAYKGGQSVFYMIEENYGADKVADFVSSLKAAKSADKALKSSIGIGEDDLNDKWQVWLRRQFWNEINLHDDPEEVAKGLTLRKDEPSGYNVAPKLSPSGDKLVYLTDRDGTFDVRLMSAIDGKDLGRLVEGERSSAFESMFVLRPGFTWSPDGGRIAFAARSRNVNTLYTFDVRRRRVVKRFKFDLDGLFEPTWSPDGNKIAVVGIKDGWSDVYVVDLANDALTRITRDPYDERHLAWSPDGKWIAMSSDRPSANLAYDGRKDFSFGHYDIYLLSPDGAQIRRIAASPGDETHPVWGPDSKRVAFVSDRTGIGNVYFVNVDGTDLHPVTNLLSGVQDLDWSSDGRTLVFSAYHKGGLDIFTTSKIVPGQMADLPLTRLAKRERGLEDRTFVEMARADHDSTASPSDSLKAGADTLATRRTAVDRKIEKWVSDQMALAAIDARKGGGDSEEADEAGKKSDSSVPVDKADRERSIRPYKPKLKVDYLTGAAGFDTFYGVNSNIQLGMSDVLGDHQLTIQTGTNLSIKDSDLFITYAYLKHQTDYAAQIFHTRSFFFSGGTLLADRYYGAGGVLARPFSRFTRLELGTQFFTIQREDLGEYYNPYVSGGYFGGTTRGQSGVGLFTQRALITHLAFVDDTTIQSLFGPVDGSRMRLAVEGSRVGMDYVTVQADFRKYVRMLDEYTLAFRLAGGTGFGPNRSRFFLGGVNNQLNPSYYTVASVPTDEVYFSTFIWPLRGAHVLEMAGDSYLLGNVAFRFPLIRSLAMGWPLPLFLRNVEGELFMDIGGAFDRNNFDPWEARNGGFELRDLKAGYGFGVRANLGMFLFRYDLAWPTNLAQTYGPMQYFSIDYTGLF